MILWIAWLINSNLLSIVPKNLYSLCLQIPFPASSPICEPLVLMKPNFPPRQCCVISLCFCACRLFCHTESYSSFEAKVFMKPFVTSLTLTGLLCCHGTSCVRSCRTYIASRTVICVRFGSCLIGRLSYLFFVFGIWNSIWHQKYQERRQALVVSVMHLGHTSYLKVVVEWIDSGKSLSNI